MSAATWLFAFALGAAPMQAPNVATPFVANLPAEYALSAGALGLTLILDGAVTRSLGGNLPCRTLDNGGRCDPATLWPLDRRGLGLHSGAWATVSDVGQNFAVGGSVVAVLADALMHHQGRARHDAATDFLVLLESFATSTAINHLVKYAVRRPRPQLYILGGHRGVDGQLSFPSGHTAATASALTAWATIFAHRHPQSRWRAAPYAVAAGVTALVAYGRVAAPKHFATDVLAAAVLGGAIGYAVPKLHVRLPGHTLTLQAITLGGSAENDVTVGVALAGGL